MPHKGYKQTPEVIEKRRLAQFGKTRASAKGWIAHGKRVIMYNQKEMLEHRVIMEKHLGRPLEREEVVHHIDKNPLNNHIDNLQLMTRSSHSTFHDTGKIRTGQSTEDSKRRVSERMRMAWAEGKFNNRPPKSDKTKQKISESMKAVRAKRFWSSLRQGTTSTSGCGLKLYPEAERQI